MADKPGLSHEAGDLFTFFAQHILRTYFRVLDINLRETQTFLIFCNARERSVLLNDVLVADFKTIWKVPVLTAIRHTAPISSAL